MGELPEIALLFATAALVLIPLWLVILAAQAAQAWTAHALGDDTALQRGAGTLHFGAHWSAVGMLALPVVALLGNEGAVAGPWPVVGFAAPLALNAGRFTRRVSVRFGLGLVAAASAGTHVLLALASFALLEVVADPLAREVVNGVCRSNAALVLLHVVPLQPMPTQRLVSSWLAPHRALRFERFNYRYGTFLLAGGIVALHGPFGALVSLVFGILPAAC